MPHSSDFSYYGGGVGDGSYSAGYGVRTDFDAFDANDPSYLAGGFSNANLYDQEASPDSFTGIIGRLKNNISGTTAANMFSANEAEKARQFNSSEAKLQRDWEERMASTTYQRTVADMKAAGLNPAMLSGLSGSSATSVGSGSAASQGSSPSSKSSNGKSIVGSLLKAAFAIAMMS